MRGARYLNTLVQDFKLLAKEHARERKQRLTPFDLQQVNYRYALDRLAEMTARQVVDAGPVGP